mgnify:CR=1 FL=1
MTPVISDRIRPGYETDMRRKLLRLMKKKGECKRQILADDERERRIRRFEERAAQGLPLFD